MLEKMLHETYKKPMRDILSVNSKTLANYIGELKDDKYIWNIAEQVYNRQLRKGVKSFLPLYVTCRETKPKKVVETGVANGVSSSFILKGLDTNDEGNLYSIDFQNERYKKFMSGKEVGWIIPNNLRQRWNLVEGRSNEVLSTLLNEIGNIQIFLHDSSHNYRTMLYEFVRAWGSISEGGFLLADDVNRNSALDRFCKSNGYRSYYSMKNVIKDSKDRLAFLKK